jgi:GxxExxY protein
LKRAKGRNRNPQDPCRNQPGFCVDPKTIRTGHSVFDEPEKYITFNITLKIEKYDTIPMSIGIQNTNSHQKNLEPIPEELDVIGKQIVDAAYTLHKKLGPGLLEKVYEICFCHELSKRGLSYQRQIDVPIIYDNIEFDEGLRLDVFVEKKIICELKARETINPVWPAQVLSHLKLTKTRLGYLINFNVVSIRNGIKRIAN